MQIINDQAQLDKISLDVTCILKVHYYTCLGAINSLQDYTTYDFHHLGQFSYITVLQFLFICHLLRFTNC